MGLDEWQSAPHHFHGVLVLEDAAAPVATSGYMAAALALAAGTLIAGGVDIAFYAGDPGGQASRTTREWLRTEGEISWVVIARSSTRRWPTRSWERARMSRQRLFLQRKS
jgi:hypothetical protein